MATNPRCSNGSARRALRARVRSLGLPCGICGHAIDYSLPAGHPMSYELDEVVPVSRYKEGGYQSARQCALDSDNVRPVHRICNQRRGNGLRKPKRGRPNPPRRGLPTSRDW